MNREQFLALVREYVAKDPETAVHVAEYARQGLSESQTQRRAAAMEAAPALSLTPRNKPAVRAIVVRQDN